MKKMVRKMVEEEVCDRCEAHDEHSKRVSLVIKGGKELQGGFLCAGCLLVVCNSFTRKKRVSKEEKATEAVLEEIQADSDAPQGA